MEAEALAEVTGAQTPTASGERPESRPVSRQVLGYKESVWAGNLINQA